MQEASLYRSDVGLEPDPYLVGSSEWWTAIDSGEIPRVIVTGTIARVWWGSMGDWPMFSIEQSGGDVADWTREGDYTRYVEGLAVRLTYVTQQFKDAVPTATPGDAHTRLVLAVELELSDERSTAEVPGPFKSG